MSSSNNKHHIFRNCSQNSSSIISSKDDLNPKFENSLKSGSISESDTVISNIPSSAIYGISIAPLGLVIALAITVLTVFDTITQYLEQKKEEKSIIKAASKATKRTVIKTVGATFALSGLVAKLIG